MSEKGPERSENPLESELKVEEQKFLDNVSETASHAQELSNWEQLRMSASEGVRTRVKAINDFFLADASGGRAFLSGVLSAAFIGKMAEHVLSGNPEGVLLGIGAAAIAVQAIYEQNKQLEQK